MPAASICGKRGRRPSGSTPASGASAWRSSTAPSRDNLVRQSGHCRQSRPAAHHEGGMTMQHDDNTSDARSWPPAPPPRRAGAALAQPAARQGPARLARHGPAGARRRLRPDGLCAQPRPGRQAPRLPTATGRAPSSARPSASPMGRPRSRGSTSTAPSDGECTGQYLHSRRRVARQSCRRLCLPGRAVREGGRALRHPRLHQCRRRRRQPLPDGRAGAPRGRLGLPERQDRSAAIPTGSISPRIRPARTRRLRGDA